MAYVIGPNGVRTSVPDDVARSLVGSGKRGYQFWAPAPAPDPKPVPKKRAPARRTTKKTTSTDD